MTTNPLDLCKCDFCGVTEHIDLLDGFCNLDGEDPSGGRLSCIRCYPKAVEEVDACGEWAMTNPNDIEKSVVPEFKPLYEAYLQS